ncbi:MAG TPA: xanthine dehydrogenase family protein molybdopterin-binding subunit [Steroidobacteraceae bacterium]|nr:xanthine dehydrogenase family protein molybdopterin-binding subunit [Steroidobacteraceae bacterium]
MSDVIGEPLDRVDGRLKVCGKATFAAEHNLPRLCYASILYSRVPSGTIRAFDVRAAERAPGVLLILTPDNAPALPQGGRAGVNPPAGRVLSLLQDRQVYYHSQPIGVVIAESPEQAAVARSLVRVSYEAAGAQLDFVAAARASAYSPAESGLSHPHTARGDFPGAFANAEVRVEQTYSTPMEHHNPMEPHATVALWEADHLTVYDATQYVSGVQTTLSKVFGIAAQNIHVVSPYVGGGFGCKGSMWSHVALAAMAARKVARPVKVVLERTEMFGPVGGRPQTEQRVALGARRDGTLVALSHSVISHTSVFEDFTEPCTTPTRMLYACPNRQTEQKLVKLNVGTPTFQRAPGEATGTFALEVAMDELAVALDLDPVELRLRNYAEREPESERPWSSKSLRACYQDGMRRFGWAGRPPPRSLREGHEWIGWGMATATYPCNRRKAAASARYLKDGTALVQSGTQELGTGTYTVMTQVAAEALGLPPAAVTFQLGDSTLPAAPVSGGSCSVASVAPAVRAACEAARAELIARGTTLADSPLAGVPAADIDVADGWLVHRSQRGRRLRVATVVEQQAVAISGSAELERGAEKDQYAMHSFGAVFAEVRVDADLGRIRVPRIVASYGVGRLLNAKTGKSQLVGGIVMGVGMALLEESLLDRATGRFVNANLADYHVPVNADIGSIEVAVVPEEDRWVNSVGAKGIGEIGITGVAGALCNAVYHATGRRLRSLPLTPDKLLAAERT